MAWARRCRQPREAGAVAGRVEDGSPAVPGAEAAYLPAGEQAVAYQEGREVLQEEVVYRPAAHSSPRAHPQTAGEAGQPATAGSGQPTTFRPRIRVSLP